MQAAALEIDFPVTYITAANGTFPESAGHFFPGYIPHFRRTDALHDDPFESGSSGGSPELRVLLSLRHALHDDPFRSGMVARVRG
jgi:hypothetical protein